MPLWIKVTIGAVITSFVGILALVHMRQQTVPEVDLGTSAPGTVVSQHAQAPIQTRSPRDLSVLKGLAPIRFPEEQPHVTFPAPRPFNIAPALDWRGIRPASLMEGGCTPESDCGRRLNTLAGNMGRILADYKLGLIKRIEQCLGDRAVATGDIQLHLSFRVNESGLGTADAINPREVTMTEGDDVALECIRSSHMGHSLQVDAGDIGEDGMFHWGTVIHFPLKNDRVYGSVFGQF